MDNLLPAIGSVCGIVIAYIAHRRVTAKAKIQATQAVELAKAEFTKDLLKDQAQFRDTLIKELNDTKKEVRDYRTENLVMNKELTDLKIRVEILSNNNDKLSQENDHLRTELVVLKSQIYSLELERGINLEKIKVLEIHVKELERQLAARDEV